MTKEKRNRPTTGDSPLKMGSLWIQAYRLNPSKPSSQESRGFNHGSVNNGSAFDDKMAFADALHELQEDGWNPEAGKEYRQSKDFKKLEKQLLNGRKPTRRYRQLRDALCDNEREYRYFMESKPDVFDPNEKVEKPFAGLGADVGQAAMLRLTAKHRGIEDAVRLARRDQSSDVLPPPDRFAI